VFVKICGITSEEDALLAVAMGADAVGFIFAPSPRKMIPEDVRDIAKRLPPEIVTVGVFRDEHPQRVVDVVHLAGLRCAQLHGHEASADVRWIRERVQAVIQGVTAGEDAFARARDTPADIVLVDGPRPGTGTVFDWSLAEGAPSGMRVMLAGGLSPDNVAAAIRKVRPWGVDVASGVESGPGRKDATLVRRFVEAAKLAGEEILDIDTSAPTLATGGVRPFDWAEDDL
jgi:phosphoribosylanthranilate isomerase